VAPAQAVPTRSTPATASSETTTASGSICVGRFGQPLPQVGQGASGTTVIVMASSPERVVMPSAPRSEWRLAHRSGACGQWWGCLRSLCLGLHETHRPSGEPYFTLRAQWATSSCRTSSLSPGYWPARSESSEPASAGPVSDCRSGCTRSRSASSCGCGSGTSR